MTAGQIHQEILDNLNSKVLDDNPTWIDREPTVEGLIKFAQYHVEQALQAAAEKAGAIEGWSTGFSGNAACVDVNSILNAYSLENIK